jgi:hypothetical protein
MKYKKVDYIFMYIRFGRKTEGRHLGLGPGGNLRDVTLIIRRAALLCPAGADGSLKKSSTMGSAAFLEQVRGISAQVVEQVTLSYIVGLIATFGSFIRPPSVAPLWCGLRQWSLTFWLANKLVG